MKYDKIKAPKRRDPRVDRLLQQSHLEDCVKFSMNIPRHIHRRFKVKTALEGKEMKDILMPIILKYIEKE